MSALVVLMLASAPSAAPAEAVETKPRKKCEYVSEVGSNRPRRVCQVIQPKPTGDQARKDAKPAMDNQSQNNGEPKE